MNSPNRDNQVQESDLVPAAGYPQLEPLDLTRKPSVPLNKPSSSAHNQQHHHHRNRLGASGVSAPSALSEWAGSFWQSSEWVALKATSHACLSDLLHSQLHYPPAQEEPLNLKVQKRPRSPTPDCGEGLPTASPVPTGSLSSSESAAAAAAASSSSSSTKQEATRRCRKCGCPNCTAEALGLMMGTRDGPKIHVCAQCGKEYRKTSQLDAHIRAHNDERPFVCTFLPCTRAFTRSDELQRHIRIHTGEKRFVCEICHKGFTRSDHFRKHRKVHAHNQLP